MLANFPKLNHLELSGCLIILRHFLFFKSAIIPLDCHRKSFIFFNLLYLSIYFIIILFFKSKKIIEDLG